jgi:hypothetical protein
MKSLNKLGAVWGCFAVLIYPYVRKMIVLIKRCILLGGLDEYAIYGKWAKYYIVLLVVVTLIVLILLYITYRRTISKNNLKDMRRNMIDGIGCCGIGMSVCIIMLHIVLRILIKIDPYYMLNFTFLPFPFIYWNVSNISKDIIMILVSLGLLTCDIAIETKRIISK